MNQLHNNHNTMIVIMLILFGTLMFAIGGLAMFLFIANNII